MLNKPLRVWHALVAMVAVLALGVTGTAIAVHGKNDAAPAKTTSTAGPFKYVVTSEHTNHATTQDNAEAHCPNNYHVLGGGVSNSGPYNTEHVNDTHPTDDGDNGSAPDDNWLVHLDNISGGDQTFQVYAICGK